MSTPEEKCPHEGCGHPLDRHTAWWGGCKYCPCGWLSDAQARGALLYFLVQQRTALVENTHVQAQLDRSLRIAIETALDAAIHALRAHGVTPLPNECDYDQPG